MAPVYGIGEIPAVIIDDDGRQMGAAPTVEGVSAQDLEWRDPDGGARVRTIDPVLDELLAVATMELLADEERRRVRSLGSQRDDFLY
ncbi:MAG: hypothetical protein ACRYG8_50025 [Janthinobacterium lividum]